MSFVVTRGLGGANLVVRGLGSETVLVYTGSDDPFALTTVEDLWARATVRGEDLSEFTGWEVTTRAAFMDLTGIDVHNGLTKITRQDVSAVQTDDLTTVTIH